MLNPSIILAGQQPDMVNVLARANAAAGQATEMQNARQYRNALKEFGAGAFRGDENAMAELARFDPAGMQAMQVQRQNAELAQRQEARLTDQHKLALAEYARGISAEQLAREQQATEQAVMRGAQLARLGDLQGANMLFAEVGLPPIDDVSQLPAIVGVYEQARDYLGFVKEQAAGPKRNTQNVDGVLYEVPEQGPVIPLTEPRDRAPLVYIGGGEDGAGGAYGPTDNIPTENVETGGGRNAFGVLGVAGGLVNRATDFLAGQEMFPQIAEAQRFFRSLEEDGLVGLAQAYPRMPASDLMERIRRLLPNVGTVEGAQAANKELEQLEARFDRDLRNAMRMRGRGSAAAQAENDRRILALQGLIQQVQEGQRLLTPPEQGEISADDEAYLRSIGVIE